MIFCVTLVINVFDPRFLFYRCDSGNGSDIINSSSGNVSPACSDYGGSAATDRLDQDSTVTDQSVGRKKSKDSSLGSSAHLDDPGLITPTNCTPSDLIPQSSEMSYLHSDYTTTQPANTAAPLSNMSYINNRGELTTPTVRVWPAADSYIATAADTLTSLSPPPRPPYSPHKLTKQDSNDNELSDETIDDQLITLRHIEELKKRGFINWQHSLDTDSWNEDSCDTLSDISQHSHNDTTIQRQPSGDDSIPISSVVSGVVSGVVGGVVSTKQSPPLSRTSTTDSDLSSLMYTRQLSGGGGQYDPRSVIRPSADSLSSLDDYFSQIHITDYDDSIDTFKPSHASTNYTQQYQHQLQQQQQQPSIQNLVIPHPSYHHTTRLVPLGYCWYIL